MMFKRIQNALGAVTEQQQFQGMNQAADYLIRGLSPFFEDRGDGTDATQRVPQSVTEVLRKLEAGLEGISDLARRNAVYLMGLHTLGETVGKACQEKALRGQDSL